MLSEDADLDGGPSGSARIEFLGVLATTAGRWGRACRPPGVGAEKFIASGGCGCGCEGISPDMPKLDDGHGGTTCSPDTCCGFACAPLMFPL